MWERRSTKPKNVYRQNMIGSSNFQIGSSVTINGKTWTAPPGTSVSVVNGNVYFDGKKADDIADATKDEQIVNIEIHGPVGSVETNGTVAVDGNVLGDVRADGSVNCGEVHGSVAAGGSVKSKGNINSNVQAGGSVQCQNISGNVMAGGSVKYGK